MKLHTHPEEFRELITVVACEKHFHLVSPFP